MNENAYRFLTRFPADYGQMLGYKDLVPELHGEWMRQMLLGAEDMTLQAHRGSYKTTCLSVMLASSLMLHADKNIIFLRKTDGDVTEVIKQVQQILLQPVSQSVFLALTGKPLYITRANSTEVTTSAYYAPRGAAQLLGIGIGGSLTGKHADIVITDDIINLKDRISQAERNRTKAAYQELQNIRNRGGRIINTGTPWHPDDAFQLMPPAIKHDCYMQPRLISDSKLAQLKASMAPSLFAANYELRHIASENALFATEPPFTDDETLIYDGIAHIDAAYGGEDYTAFTCGRRVGGTLYLYGRLWPRHVDTVLDAILAECDRLRCQPIHVENNADKGYLFREVKNRGYTARVYAEKMNKYYKISTFLRKWWGNIVFLPGTDPAYIAQIMDYTEDAEHDDAPDSAACICRIFDRRE